MLNSPLDSPGGPDAKPEDVERIVQEGPHGAIVVAGIATFVVVAPLACVLLFGIRAAGSSVMTNEASPRHGASDRRGI